LTIAKNLIELGLLAEALEWLKGVLQLDDEIAETWYLLSMTHKLRGEAKEAADCVQEGLRLATDSGDDDSDLLPQLHQLASELSMHSIAEGDDDDGEDDDSEDPMDG